MMMKYDMKRYGIPVFVVFLLLFSCREENPTETAAIREPAAAVESPEVKSPAGPAVAAYNGTVNDDNLRLRELPSLRAPVVKTLNGEEKVYISARTYYRQKIGDSESYWLKVQTSDGIEGWSYGAFIDTDQDREALDIAVRTVPLIAGSPGEPVRYSSPWTPDETVTITSVSPAALYEKEGESFARSGSFLEPYDKKTILRENFVFVEKSEGEMYLKLTGDGNLYVRERDILTVPYLCRIIEREDDGDERFFHLADEPGGSEGSLLHKSDPEFTVYDWEKRGEDFWFQLSGRSSYAAEGWFFADPAYYSVEPDPELSSTLSLFDNLFAFSYDSSMEGQKELFGDPFALYTVTVDNRYSDVDDVIYTYEYNGLLVTIYHVVHMDKDILLGIKVFGDTHPLNNHFYPGQPVEEIVSLLGEPFQESEGVLYYSSDPDGFETVKFHIEDGVLRAVEKSWGID